MRRTDGARLADGRRGGPLARRLPERFAGRFAGAGRGRVVARTVGAAQLAEEPKSDEGEDLNIPSFLRRLAN